MVGLSATLDAPAVAAVFDHKNVAASGETFSAADDSETIAEQADNTGGGGGGAGLSFGQSSRGVIGDIAKVVKIAELIGSVGETVIPALVSAGTAAVGGADGPVAQAAQRTADEVLGGGNSGGGASNGSGGGGATTLRQRLLHTFRPQEVYVTEDIAVKMPATT